MPIVYQVTLSYHAEILYTDPLIVGAIRFASAAAMHAGKAFHVHRACISSFLPVPGEPRVGIDEARFQLLTITPSSVDFRRVSPETVMGAKALAHELWETIDEEVDAMKLKKEGFHE